MKTQKTKPDVRGAVEFIRVYRCLSVAAFGLASFAFQANAQPTWQPTKNIEIVVPSAPGGSNDKTARSIERVTHDKRLLIQTLSVVNKPGGGNAMTMNYLNQHMGDAHYLMIGTPTILTNHIIGASNLNYTDFTPVASLFNEYIVFAVKADSTLKSGRELAERLKKDPKSVSIGFATALGSHNHIAAGLLAKAIGGDIRALKVIAFKGSSEAVAALLGGHIDLVTTAAGNVADQVEAGKLRIVGVAANQRLPAPYANVPTWKEQGVNVVFGGWRSIMGPKNMTAAQTAYWEKVLAQVVAQPEWKTDLERNYLSDDFATGERFRTELKQDYASMKAVLSELGLAKN
ncbi:MAG: tctC6 [Betaproteobacteria bacterium]|nr:tctC6 [Betaproteobacteria bacterium]